jgi:hypothetical protein
MDWMRMYASRLYSLVRIVPLDRSRVQRNAARCTTVAGIARILEAMTDSPAILFAPYRVIIVRDIHSGFLYPLSFFGNDPHIGI